MVSFGNLTFQSSWNLCYKVWLKINFLKIVYFFKTNLNKIPVVHLFRMFSYQSLVVTCPSATYCLRHVSTSICLPCFSSSYTHHLTLYCLYTCYLCYCLSFPFDCKLGDTETLVWFMLHFQTYNIIGGHMR